MRTMAKYFIQFFINVYNQKVWVAIREPGVEPTHSLKQSDLKTLIGIGKVFYKLYTAGNSVWHNSWRFYL